MTVYGVAANDPARDCKRRLNEVKAELQRRHAQPIPTRANGGSGGTGAHSVLRRARNQNALWIFSFQVGRLWHRALSAAQSERAAFFGIACGGLINRWLPVPIVLSSLSPAGRMGVVT